VDTPRQNAGRSPSPGAERMRRVRHLRRRGAVVVHFVIGADAIQTLIEPGWLDPSYRVDRNAVTCAVIDLVTRALANRIMASG
jgi:hypothetical protein